MRRTVLVMAPAMRADVNARVTGLAKTARIVSKGPMLANAVWIVVFL